MVFQIEIAHTGKEAMTDSPIPLDNTNGQHLTVPGLCDGLVTLADRYNHEEQQIGSAFSKFDFQWMNNSVHRTASLRTSHSTKMKSFASTRSKSYNIPDDGDTFHPSQISPYPRSSDSDSECQTKIYPDGIDLASGHRLSVISLDARSGNSYSADMTSETCTREVTSHAIDSNSENEVYVHKRVNSAQRRKDFINLVRKGRKGHIHGDSDSYHSSGSACRSCGSACSLPSWSSYHGSAEFHSLAKLPHSTSCTSIDCSDCDYPFKHAKKKSHHHGDLRNRSNLQSNDHGQHKHSSRHHHRHRSRHSKSHHSITSSQHTSLEDDLHSDRHKRNHDVRARCNHIISGQNIEQSTNKERDSSRHRGHSSRSHKRDTRRSDERYHSDQHRDIPYGHKPLCESKSDSCTREKDVHRKPQTLNLLTHTHSVDCGIHKSASSRRLKQRACSRAPSLEFDHIPPPPTPNLASDMNHLPLCRTVSVSDHSLVLKAPTITHPPDMSTSDYSSVPPSASSPGISMEYITSDSDVVISSGISTDINPESLQARFGMEARRDNFLNISQSELSPPESDNMESLTMNTSSNVTFNPLASPADVLDEDVVENSISVDSATGTSSYKIDYNRFIERWMPSDTDFMYNQYSPRCDDKHMGKPKLQDSAYQSKESSTDKCTSTSKPNSNTVSPTCASNIMRDQEQYHALNRTGPHRYYIITPPCYLLPFTSWNKPFYMIVIIL